MWFGVMAGPTSPMAVNGCIFCTTRLPVCMCHVPQTATVTARLRYRLSGTERLSRCCVLIQAAAAAAAEDLKQAEERTQQAQHECAGLRTRTTAAERARLDATRALEDAKSTAEGLRRERDRLGKKGREQEERAGRDAAEARKEIQYAPLPHL